MQTSQRSAITYPNKRGAGRKGRQPRRARVYQQRADGNRQNSTNGAPPFTEIWHNNEPLVVCHVSTIPSEKNRCSYCAKEFPKNFLAIVPFDIALKHRERWQYPNRDRKSNSEPAFHPGPANKMTTKYYCINNACIMGRFPCFQEQLIELPEGFAVKDSHKGFFADSLNVFFKCGASMDRIG